MSIDALKCCPDNRAGPFSGAVRVTDGGGKVELEGDLVSLVPAPGTVPSGPELDTSAVLHVTLPDKSTLSSAI